MNFLVETPRLHKVFALFCKDQLGLALERPRLNLWDRHCEIERRVQWNGRNLSGSRDRRSWNFSFGESELRTSVSLHPGLYAVTTRIPGARRGGTGPDPSPPFFFLFTHRHFLLLTLSAWREREFPQMVMRRVHVRGYALKFGELNSQFLSRSKIIDCLMAQRVLDRIGTLKK
jgi:hypothetical protein